MDPTEFIQLGVKLLGRNTEAELRTAVSRFYYGAFHIAYQMLVDKCGIVIPENQAHAKLPQLFWYSEEPHLDDVGRQLNSLRKMRRLADYDLDDPTPRQPAWASALSQPNFRVEGL